MNNVSRQSGSRTLVLARYIPNSNVFEIMNDTRPKVLSTSWDGWNHPKRAIAAIWGSVAVALVVFVFSLPVLFELPVHPLISIGTAVLFISAAPIAAVRVAARFD